MKIGKKGLELIKVSEGLKLTAYRCPAGVLTIGYGHTRGVRLGDKITKLKAEQFLLEDVEDSEDAVNRLVKSKINQNQFDALVDFVFNLGEGNFSKSTLLKMINTNPNDPKIKSEIEKWKHSGKEVLAGLARRRCAESILYFESCES